MIHKSTTYCQMTKVILNKHWKPKNQKMGQTEGNAFGVVTQLEKASGLSMILCQQLHGFTRDIFVASCLTDCKVKCAIMGIGEVLTSILGHSAYRMDTSQVSEACQYNTDPWSPSRHMEHQWPLAGTKSSCLATEAMWSQDQLLDCKQSPTA